MVGRRQRTWVTVSPPRHLAALPPRHRATLLPRHLTRSLNSAIIHSLGLADSGGKRTFFSPSHGQRITVHDTALGAVKQAEFDSSHTRREDTKIRRYANERDRYLRLNMNTKPNACLGDIKEVYEKIKDDMSLELSRWDGYLITTASGKRIVLELIFKEAEERDNMNTAIGARFGCNINTVHPGHEKALKSRAASEMDPDGDGEDANSRHGGYVRDDASHASARSVGAQSLSQRYKH